MKVRFRIEKISVSHDSGNLLKIANIHHIQLSAGIMSKLGVGLLQDFYRFAITDSTAFLLVAFEADATVGFVLGSENPEKFYLSYLVRRGFMALRYLLPFVLKHPSKIKDLFSLHSHMATVVTDLPKAELLAIAIAPSMERTGLGTALLSKFCQEMAERGASSFKVTAAETQKSALKFYEKSGGNPVQNTRIGPLNAYTFIIQSFQKIA